jgi:membrane-associated HD superfamily phosphohydrolase
MKQSGKSLLDKGRDDESWVSEATTNSTAPGMVNPANKSSAAGEDSLGKRCQVCRKGFVLRRKIICQVCFSCFCSDHCTRKRFLMNESVSICDTCDLEETKKDIDEEISKEITRIALELKESKETNESLFREHVNKVSMVNDIEMELSKQEWNHKKYEQELISTLENEQNRGARLRKVADELRNILDELNSAEKNMSEQCSEAEFLLENLKIEALQLETEKDELLGKIEKITQELRESLSLDEVRKILCEKCLTVINHNLKSEF